MTRTAWRLFDPNTGDELALSTNPEQGGDPGNKRRMSTESTDVAGAPQLVDAGPEIKDISLKSTLLSTTDRDALMVWVDKGTKVRLTNDLGEQYMIYIDRFQPTRRHAVSHDYVAGYTLHAYVLEIINVEPLPPPVPPPTGYPSLVNFPALDNFPAGTT